ncbi:tetratricopeptide repeat protein [Pyruvatibacter sp.]|uniref:tetratricopeptide repeat protein n=1 Tax=Pyruvatibacter sp. TaxID=1981328 RepID=UPI0032679719
MSASLPKTTARVVAEEFNRAIDSHQKGKLDRAKRGYKRVLQTAPNHAEALHLLGVIDLQRDNFKQAADLITKAVELAPDLAPAHYNLARALKSLGNLEPALTSVRRALELIPGDTDTWLLCTNILVELGRKEEAIAALASMLELQPDLDDIRRVRANLLMDIEETDAALEEYEYLAQNAQVPHEAMRDMAILRVNQDDKEGALPLLEKALELKPDDRQSRSLAAGLLIDLDRNRDALPIVRSLLDEDPDDTDSKLKMGILLANMRRFKDALPILEYLHEKNPEDPNPLLKLAYTYHSLERFDEAIEHYQKLKVLMPDEARSSSNLAGLYFELEEYDKALEEGMESLRLNPNVEQTYLNIGVMLQKLGDYDRAIDLYSRALTVNPDYATAGSNLAHLLLSRGQIEDGWDLYAHGFNAGLRRPMRHFDVNLWAGEDASNDTVLVWKEQGVGDDLRFASCFPDIIKRAKHVIIETDPRLVSLYQRSFPTTTVREERPKLEHTFVGPPDFNKHTPAGQLPVYFRRSLDAFPAKDGYLVPDLERVAFWRQKVEACGDGIRIGLSWRSMHQSATRNLVYTQLEDWADLIATPGVTCINLQYDNAGAEIDEFTQKTGLPLHVMEGLDLKDDLDEAAALTKACDLVVSTGTSVADMAAAVGAPVIFYADTRHPMQLGTDHFPWYPSSRFIGREARQPISEVAELITRDVQAFAEKWHAGDLD